MNLGPGLNVARNIFPFDPVAGRMADHQFSAGGGHDISALARNAAVTMVVDFLGLDGVSGGLIAEFGGGGTGLFFGFDLDGGFLFRSGGGGALPSTNTALVTAAAGVVAGDGRLVVSTLPGTPIRAAAWWNGQRIGQETEGVDGRGTWSGTNEASFLAPTVPGAITTGAPHDIVVAYSWASNLLIHETLWLGG